MILKVDGSHLKKTLKHLANPKSRMITKDIKTLNFVLDEMNRLERLRTENE